MCSVPLAAVALTCLAPATAATAAVDTEAVALHAKLCAESDSKPGPEQMTLVHDQTLEVVAGAASVRELSYDITGTNRVCDLAFLSFTVPAGAVYTGGTSFTRWETITFADDPAGSDTLTVAVDGTSRWGTNKSVSAIDTVSIDGTMVSLPAGMKLVGASNYSPTLTDTVPDEPGVPQEYRGRTYTQTSQPVEWTADLEISLANEVLAPKTAAEVARAQKERDRLVNGAAAVRASSAAIVSGAHDDADDKAEETRRAQEKAARQTRTAQLRKVSKKPAHVRKAATKKIQKRYSESVRRARLAYEKSLNAADAQLAKNLSAADAEFVASKQAADSAYLTATAPHKTTEYVAYGAGDVTDTIDRSQDAL